MERRKAVKKSSVYSLTSQIRLLEFTWNSKIEKWISVTGKETGELRGMKGGERRLERKSRNDVSKEIALLRNGGME
jgi:hypothetical protein